MAACCDADTDPIAFRVPASHRDTLPDRPRETEPVATLCPRCLTLEWPTPGDADDEPDFSRISDAFPTGEAAIPFALALGLCSSLAANREAIASLLEDVERAGTDPLLAMDRLLDDPGVEPAIDLARRRHQVEQLLY
ncbi:DUF6276 family protein [Saliphagus sp. LR7]|uniref:DUF6276 family protein n=1 Tax=Saliphagus sp. LR7 TaxID=2282654 RepID=UPI000DF73C90|nr:DUF6276 family protein [Saliphagus sp. LR7]